MLLEGSAYFRHEKMFCLYEKLKQYLYRVCKTIIYTVNAVRKRRGIDRERERERERERDIERVTTKTLSSTLA